MHNLALSEGDRTLQINKCIMVVLGEDTFSGIVLEYYDEGQ